MLGKELIKERVTEGKGWLGRRELVNESSLRRDLIMQGKN
jgi:hypothetical protein